jgi:hypothetical protein
MRSYIFDFMAEAESGVDGNKKQYAGCAARNALSQRTWCWIGVYSGTCLPTRACFPTAVSGRLISIVLRRRRSRQGVGTFYDVCEMQGGTISPFGGRKKTWAVRVGVEGLGKSQSRSGSERTKIQRIVSMADKKTSCGDRLEAQETC